MPLAERLASRPPSYFPPASGRYEVKPGLVRFGRDLGGGEADGHIFQFDSTFPRYRQAKLAARGEQLSKYFQTHALEPPVAQAVTAFIAHRLVREHPDLFKLEDARTLSCSLTGDRVRFGDGPDASTFDALAMQVQEDLAVVSTEDPRHWLSAIHLCSPNHWAAEDKIGKTFSAIHEPVAGMERMNRHGEQLVKIMLGATDGLVRFAWGMTWDDKLNQHPDPPPGSARRHAFNPARPAAFLRVERQTVWGFPDVGAALFTIRTYLYDCASIRDDPTLRGNLISAIRSMNDASLDYKRLADSRVPLMRWLETGN